MHQDRFLFFIRRSFQGFGWTVLISTCLAAVIIFSIFSLIRQKSEISECDYGNLRFVLNLIAPIQLGVDSWQIGDYARYRHLRKSSRTVDGFNREVGFHIIAALEKSGSRGYWMRKTGFSYFRTIPKDIYRYVTIHDLRITPKTPIYEFQRNYVPFHLDVCQQTTIPLAKLVKRGREEIETEAGTFECIHYYAELAQNRKPLEIWTSAAISPLGIVRVRSETDILELISFGPKTEITVPKLIQPVIEGISTLEDGCTSCHKSGNCHESIFPPK